MSRLLYEHFVSYKGYLIIPFVFGKADNYEIYSYKFLSQIGHKSKFHKVENRGGMYGSSIDNIIEIAKEHIDQDLEFISHRDNFKSRYTYHDNLIIIFLEADKYFYDHYPPDSLKQ